MVEYVRHFARSYIFSTSIPASVAAGLIEVFNILETESVHREKLLRNIAHVTQGLEALGFDTLGSTTAIVPVLIPDERKLRGICRDLHEAGLYVTPVTFPAVARGRARLRLSISSSHGTEDLDRLLGELARMKEKYKVNSPGC